MDYFGIVKKAFHISFKNKFLWIFGLLASGAAGFQGYNSLPNSFTNGSEWSKYTNGSGNFDFVTFWANYGGIILILMLVLVLLAIAFFVLNIISQGALVSSVERISSGEKPDFYDGFHDGWHQFWRVWGMNLIFLF